MSVHRLDQIRAGLRERNAQARADTARSTNPQGVHLSGDSVAFRDPETDPEEKRGWGRMFLEVINPFSDFQTGIRRGVAKGVVGAVDETVDLAVTVGGFLADVSGLGEKYGGGDFLDWWAQDDDDRNPIHIGKDVVDSMIGFRGPDTLVGGLVEGITQFAVGMVGAGKILKLASVGKVGKAFIRGAAADVVVFDANEARLGNLLINGPEWLRNPLTEFIGGITAAKETDDELIGKLKNALEGIMLGGLVHGLGVGAIAVVKRLRGDTQGARILIRDFTDEPLRGVVELPNGKARLSQGKGDTKPVLKDVGESPEGSLIELEGADVPTGDLVRRFEFPGRNGEVGAMDVRMGKRVLPDGTIVEDVLVIDRMGRLVDGKIDINPESGFRMEAGVRGKAGAELLAEFPNATIMDGLHLKSGEIRNVPTSRWKQEVFNSKGDAQVEAVAIAEMRIQNAAPMNKMNKALFEDMDKLVEAYRTNRSTATIRRMEKQLIQNMRTNMGGGRADMVSLVADIAQRLSRAGTGSAKVMAKQADKALEMMKGSGMEGILKHPELAKISDQVFIRRAAGLLMESLGSDISRYSIRINQGGSNLSVLQLGRALDQMVHLEEALTGKPAVWLDKHRKLYTGEGRLTAPDTGGGKSPLDAEAAAKDTTVEDLAARKTDNPPDVEGAGPGKPGEEGPPLDADAPTAKAQPAGDLPPAGVAPGPV